jgi:hypothetical protein
MPKKPPKLRPDAVETAYRTMLEATGQAPKTLPPAERPPEAKNAVAAARGSKGGKARAANLTDHQRKQIAKKAARKRWSDDKTA